MTIEEKLDELISFHKQYKRHKINTHLDSESRDLFVYNVQRELIDKLDINNDIINSMYKKLIDDDKLLYIDQNDQHHSILFTVEGMLFEGYIKRKENAKINLRNSVIKANILVVGSVIAGTYSVLQVLKMIYHFFCNCY